MDMDLPQGPIKMPFWNYLLYSTADQPSTLQSDNLTDHSSRNCWNGKYKNMLTYSTENLKRKTFGQMPSAMHLIWLSIKTKLMIDAKYGLKGNEICQASVLSYHTSV